jgi:ParB family transcriptional regulator, chromosome partitioning protein
MTEFSSDRRQLKQLSPDLIQRNPENPRIFFRSEEMDTLLSSIRRYGIQVPITVYSDGDHFVLIDGERRWRCASKLNLKSIPALIQPKPSQLQNLLLMFNIHALREQWDYLTIASKLPNVIELYTKENDGQKPKENELSEITGLTRGQVRRCQFLLDLPQKYRRMLEDELEKPKTLQVLSEDFFIEMERALKTVRSRVPAAIPDLNQARDSLIVKFRKKVIKNITDFRKLSKIATSIDNLGVRENRARTAITTIFNSANEVSIETIYAEHFEGRYDERKLTLNLDSLLDYLGDMEDEDSPPLSTELAERLRRLAHIIKRILG